MIINMEKDNEFEWRQFIRLGEMIGDGLHYEEPWISKEYNKLFKILCPPTPEEKLLKKEIRQKRNNALNEQIKERLKTDKCKSCNGELKQVRSGSKTVVCGCGKKYTYKTKKR